MPVLILARGLQGLGGGGIMPVVQTVISDVVSPRERGQYQAYFSGVWIAAGIGGPVLGGVFAEHLHWSMIFWINLPLALGALAMLLPKMGRSRSFIAAARSTGSVASFDGVRRGVHAGADLGRQSLLWLSPTLIAMLGASIVLTFSFIWHARRTDEPFLPLSLIGGSVVPFAIFSGGCALGAMTGLTVYLPLYYEGVYRLSASEAGLPDSAGGGFDRRCGDCRPNHGEHRHYKRVAIVGTAVAAVMRTALTLTTMPLWGCWCCCRSSRSG